MKSSLLSKAASVLEAVCSVDHPVAIKELTEILDLPLPTVSRLCADLVETGLLEKTDYHHLIPGIALMRFGQRSREFSPLISSLKTVVDDYSNISGLNAVVFGFQKNCFFNIYSCGKDNLLQDPLRYTGAFLVLLASAGIKAEKAQKIVIEKYPDMPVTEQVICDREFSELQSRKTLTRVASGRKWAITMPFVYDRMPCTLSYYGIGRENSTVEAELFNIGKVLSRIRTGLDRIGKGED